MHEKFQANLGLLFLSHNFSDLIQFNPQAVYFFID